MTSSKDWIEADPFSWWLPYIVAVLVGIITCIREYSGGPECPSKNHITNKHVLITGGSGGIAFEVALELSKRAGIITLACKNTSKGEQIKQEILKQNPSASITVKQLDVSSMKSVKQFAETNISNKKIDILINNAAILDYDFQLTDEGYETHLATNYLGHFYLTHLLIPKFNTSERARIINVTDKAHKNANLYLNDLNITTNWNANEAYSQSKLCLVLMAKHMARILSDYRITINAVAPGSVRGTNFRRNSPITNNILLKVWTGPYMWLFYKTPKQAAQSIIFAAVDVNLNKTSGKLISNCEIQTNCKKAQGEKLSKELYMKTCEMLKISPLTVK